MSTQGTRSRVPKAVWPKSTVVTFCDICIRGIEKMFRPHTHFNKEGWEFVVTEFRKETGFSYDQKQLKNKWDALKKEYKLWKNLMRNETGLGWDTNKNTIGAEDAWWEEKIKVNPGFGTFRLTGIEPELEAKLELMFFTIVATGEFAMAPGRTHVDVTPAEDQQDGVEGADNSGDWNPFEDNLEEMLEDGSTQPNLANNKRRNVEVGGHDNSNIAAKRGRRRSGGAAMMEKHIKTLVSAVTSRNSTVNSKITEPEVPSLRAAVADVKTITGIDMKSDLFMFATKFLEAKAKREVYFELELEEHKFNWLTYHFTHKGPNKNM